MTSAVYSYDELDQILRGDGHGGYVGVSAIDGLIAALVAGPAKRKPDAWLPLIFAGQAPKTRPGTPERQVIDTILRRYGEVESILRSHPEDYQPMFMNNEGQVIIYDWTVGFMMGVAAAQDAWTPILLSNARNMLRPILVGSEPGQGCLPELSRVQMERIHKTAHAHIADAVIGLYRICHKTGSVNKMRGRQ
jgi:yecA family protein